MTATARRQTIFVLVFLVVVVFFVTTFRLGVVHGESMMPTYHDGQVVLLRRRTWAPAPLKRGDVVLVRKDRDVLIKRIYRLGGEEVTDPDLLSHAFRSGPNGERLSDFYEQKPAVDADEEPRLFVPKGYLVVLGDNRAVSDDSRFFGPVPESDVLGVVVESPPPPSDSESTAWLSAPARPK